MSHKIHNNIFEAETYWINFDKWLEGEKLGKDPGDEFVMNWIQNNAEIFRSKWEQSCCCDCSGNSECGFMLRLQCERCQQDNSVTAQ